MSRILLLVLVLIWMAGSPEPRHDVWPNLALFFSFYILLVVMLGLWSRLLARRVATGSFHRQVRLFNQVMFGARVMIPVWFTVGVWGLGWGGALIKLLGDGVYRSSAGMLLGTLPAFATWMGLWWSQYPAECALREQNLLIELDNDLPLYRPPAFRNYFFSNFRLQVLFTLIPVALIIVVRDVVMWTALWWMGQRFNDNSSPTVEAGASVAAAAIVFLFSPALLARVLNTTPMSDCPLRRRLHAMCLRAGIRYRHILIWNTGNHVGNAAVMGVLPWLRYVLLSDVLLERLSDQQIEAVFAHELGHVAHRHMTWYVVFFVSLALAGNVFCRALPNSIDPTWQAICGGAGIGAMLLLFGALSRRCERQADVYAARTMQLFCSDGLAAVATEELPTCSMPAMDPTLNGPNARETAVGQQGALMFASALRRVATINNIPINPSTQARPGLWNHLTHHADALLDLANNWLHGSIAGRLDYVEHLGTDPGLTRHFDRTMFWLYSALLCVLCASLGFSLALSAM